MKEMEIAQPLNNRSKKIQELYKRMSRLESFLKHTKQTIIRKANSSKKQ